ncbi:MAG: outer membrane protein assembly factor BamB, partial [Pirellulaceae bacterium]
MQQSRLIDNLREAMPVGKRYRRYDQNITATIAIQPFPQELESGMSRQLLKFSMVLAIAVFALQTSSVQAEDWSQFMRSADHTGDAPQETLHLPLQLSMCVQLDDAVTTSPAVVGGKVYVADQMGTVYCIDRKTNRIAWKVSPDGESAMGGNTSSVCVAGGRVYFGTTAGKFHVLDADDGKLIKSVAVGGPIMGSATWANDSVYFQSLDAVVHCLDRDGKLRWRWDHYRSYQDPQTNKKATGFPG